MDKQENKNPQELTSDLLREYIHSSNPDIKRAALQRLFMENTEASHPLLKAENAGIGLGDEEDFDMDDFCAFCEIITNTELFEDEYISRQLNLIDLAMRHTSDQWCFILWLVKASDGKEQHVKQSIEILKKHQAPYYYNCLDHFFFAAENHQGYLDIIYDTLVQVNDGLTAESIQEIAQNLSQLNHFKSDSFYKIIELLRDRFGIQEINNCLKVKMPPEISKKVISLLETRFMILLNQYQQNYDDYCAEDDIAIRESLKKLSPQNAIPGYLTMIRNQKFCSLYVSEYWSYIRKSCQRFPTKEMDYLSGIINQQNAGIILEAISAKLPGLFELKDQDLELMCDWVEKVITWLADHRKWFNQIDIDNTVSIAENINDALKFIPADEGSELKDNLYDLQKNFYQVQNHGDVCASLLINAVFQNVVISDLCKLWTSTDSKFQNEFKNQLQEYWEDEFYERRYISEIAEYAWIFMDMPPMIFKSSIDESDEVSAIINRLYFFLVC